MGAPTAPRRSNDRLERLAHRLDIRPDLLMDSLEHVASMLPPGAENPSAVLTASEEQALRRSGHLAEAMPPLAERASTITSVEAARMLSQAYTVKEAAELLGRSPARVRQRLLNGTLYGVQVSGEWRLPRFQFDQRGVLPGIDRVLPALPDQVSPIAVLGFFTTPTPDLHKSDLTSPLEWLAAGHEAGPVERLARCLATTP